jgi:hypothetical protein
MLSLFFSLALATTATLETDAGSIRWSIAVDEGWKPSEELPSEVVVSLAVDGSTSTIGGGLKGAVPAAYLKMLGTPETVRVEAQLQVCRADLCKKLSLEGTAKASDFPATFTLVDHSDPVAFDARLLERAEHQAASAKKMEALKASYDPRFEAALRKKAGPVVDATLERARERKVPALIVFGGMGCKPCGALAHELFYVEGDPGKLADRVEWALVNLFHPSVADKVAEWEALGLPTSVLVAPDGTVIASIPGYSNVDTYTAWLDEHLND